MWVVKMTRDKIGSNDFAVGDLNAFPYFRQLGLAQKGGGSIVAKWANLLPAAVID